MPASKQETCHSGTPRLAPMIAAGALSGGSFDRARSHQIAQTWIARGTQLQELQQQFGGSASVRQRAVSPRIVAHTVQDVKPPAALVETVAWEVWEDAARKHARVDVRRCNRPAVCLLQKQDV